jgi:hypothetical protein
MFVSPRWTTPSSVKSVATWNFPRSFDGRRSGREGGREGRRGEWMDRKRSVAITTWGDEEGRRQW